MDAGQTPLSTFEEIFKNYDGYSGKCNYDNRMAEAHVLRSAVMLVLAKEWDYTRTPEDVIEVYRRFIKAIGG